MAIKRAELAIGQNDYYAAICNLQRLNGVPYHIFKALIEMMHKKLTYESVCKLLIQHRDTYMGAVIAQK